MNDTASKLREIDEKAKMERETALKTLADQVIALLKPLDPKDRVKIMFRIGQEYSSCCGETRTHGYCSKCNR